MASCRSSPAPLRFFLRFLWPRPPSRRPSIRQPWCRGATRSEHSFDFDWRFKIADDKTFATPAFNDSAWRKLDVPHDWSIEGEYKEDNPGVAVSAFLPTGIAWYRKSFNVTADMLKQNVTLWFDGVFMDSTVYLNGVALGTEPYGYMSFFYDLNRHLRPG